MAREATNTSGMAGKKGISHGLGGAGLGLGKTSRPGGLKRHRKILRDNIQGVTKGAIRLARRGGVKRISGDIYDETRKVLKLYLEGLLKEITDVVETCKRKTVCVTDVVYVLRRQGRPIYGFGTAEIRG